MKWAALIWLVVNSALYFKNGIKIVADSERYLEYGRGLLNGFYFDSHNFWYIGYSVFVGLLGNVDAIIVAQYLLSFAAVFALYQGSFLLFSSRAGSLITCMLFLCFIDISQWNSYVVTESLYTSFICFSIYGLTLIFKGERKMLIPILLIVVLTAMIKPTGVAILGALIAVFAFKKPLSIALIGVLFIFLVNRMLTTYLVIENYHSGEVIYAVTTTSVKGLVVQPPVDAYTPPESYPPLIKIVAFIFHHPVYWTNLFLHKVFSLLSNTRPFWSMTHNLFSAAILLLAYSSFIIGIRSKIIGRDVVIFAITFLSIHILSVGITSDDWDGRFLIPMLPVIFIFSGHGLATWRYRKSTQ